MIMLKVLSRKTKNEAIDQEKLIALKRWHLKLINILEQNIKGEPAELHNFIYRRTISDIQFDSDKCCSSIIMGTLDVQNLN